MFFDDLTLTHLGAKLLQSTDYYPYGSVASQWTDEDYRFGYQGLFAEKDDETGLAHFEARDYDAIAGRWMAVDPEGQFSSAYVVLGNLPHLAVDPDGRLAWFLPLVYAAGTSAVANLIVQTFRNMMSLQALDNIDFGEVGKSALRGALTFGLDEGLGGLNIYGAISNAGLQAALGVGLNGVVNATFGDPFFEGAANAAIYEGIRGGINGGIAASQSQFDRSILFGTLTKSGRQQAFLHFAQQYNLQANGVSNIKFAILSDAYGTTEPLDPNTGQPISLGRAAISYPQGVNSEVTFGLGRLMSLEKVRANVIHEGQHVIDLKAGRATQFRNAATTNMGFIGRFEISAHRAVHNLGLQRAYNLSRIRYWLQFP